jgi:beta-aspartyl-peptidase (threonine type)
MEYGKYSLKEAAELVINEKLVKQEALGGIIGIDNKGNIVMSFNTDGMFRGYITNNSEPIVQLYKE